MAITPKGLIMLSNLMNDLIADPIVEKRYIEFLMKHSLNVEKLSPEFLSKMTTEQRIDLAGVFGSPANVVVNYFK